MERLPAVLKAIVPGRLRDALRAAHRHWVLRRALRRFLSDPGSCSTSDSALLGDLIYGWGNEAWSAQREYLAESVRHVMTARGPILECGSGLSTLLMGALAQQRGLPYWALEHIPEWAMRVQRHLDRYGLDRVVLHVAPLRDHGGFDWYDPPLSAMPAGFSLVICDGPPGGTRGGRYGLVPVMRKRFAPGCVILLDDAGREQEHATARRWERELGAPFRTLGTGKPYITMTVRDRSPHPSG